MEHATQRPLQIVQRDRPVGPRSSIQSPGPRSYHQAIAMALEGKYCHTRGRKEEKTLGGRLLRLLRRRGIGSDSTIRSLASWDYRHGDEAERGLAGP
jgi:hypothetical protein